VSMPPPLPRPNWRPRYYLCHRGADPLIVQEVAGYFRQQYYEVVVQDGDGLSLSLPEFRNLARQQLEAGCNDLIVLLNEKFPGSAYRSTLNIVAKALKISPYAIHVDDCDYCEASLPWADLIGADTPEKRRTILQRSGRTLRKQSLR
jgi:hypothetical protein